MSENDQKNEAMFMQLILTFQMAAWQQMGKIKNPITDKIEKDLHQAQFSIDMLEMIRSKTEGNLNENEKQFLNRNISELQLNFIDEMNKEQKAQEQAKEKGTEEGTKAKQEEKEKKSEEVPHGNEKEHSPKSQKSKKGTPKKSKKKS